MTRATAAWPELSFGALDGILGLHITMASAAIVQNFKKKLEPLQLTQKQTSLLWLVGDNPGVSQVDFARLFRIDRATMLGITNSLTQRGLVERRPTPNHGRRLGLHLTPAGKKVLEEAKTAVAAHEKWVKKRFTQAEVVTLKSWMKRLYV